MRIKIADYVFDIEMHFPIREASAKEYITDEPFDYSFHIPKETIIERTKKSREQARCATYADTEWLEIYRVICEYIEQRDGVMMHGAVIGFGGNAYMFTAPSGTGKTTHINQWRTLYGDSVSVINGDKPIIRLIGGEYIVYGTPWCGKESLNINTSLPLKGIAILSRGKENKIERVNAAQYVPSLMRQVYIHPTEECADKAADFIDKMFSSVPIYSLQCNISTKAAEVAAEMMCKNL